MFPIIKIDSGVSVKLPPNIEGQIRSRSGLASKGIVVINSPGTRDPDFSGKIGIILINHSKIPYQINNGDSICQLCFSPVSINEIFFVGEETNIVPKKQYSGDQGFGSTGRKNISYST